MKLTLVRKEQEAPNVVSFFWKADPLITWKAGQFLYYNLHLPKPDPRGNVRHFTIASSPTEKLIQLTTNIREESIFKQTLNSLEPGAEVEGTGPRGDFVLPDPPPTIPQIYLAGGIGITPFRSMIKFAANKKLSTPIHLIYSNSTPEDIVFKKELDLWSEQNENFAISYAITKPEESRQPWNGLTGRINSDLIQKSLEIRNLKLEILTIKWWACGPPAFVSAMQDELQKLNIPPDKIEIEQFTGY